MRAAAEKMPDFAVTLRFPRKTLSDMPGTASGTVQIVRARLVKPGSESIRRVSVGSSSESITQLRSSPNLNPDE